MVYRLDQDEVRHDRWPLRLGARGTDEVVEAHQVRCSHYDAFRFFTAEASGRNALQPTRSTQLTMEQPGCLHAGMDVYKWCFKLAPAVPGDLTLDAFELAADIRTLDMQASPYDLLDLGLEPIRIETPEGKREYASAQKDFTDRSNTLRRRLLDVCGLCRSGLVETSRDLSLLKPYSQCGSPRQRALRTCGEQRLKDDGAHQRGSSTGPRSSIQGTEQAETTATIRRSSIRIWRSCLTRTSGRAPPSGSVIPTRGAIMPRRSVSTSVAAWSRCGPSSTSTTPEDRSVVRKAIARAVPLRGRPQPVDHREHAGAAGGPAFARR